MYVCVGKSLYKKKSDNSGGESPKRLNFHIKMPLSYLPITSEENGRNVELDIDSAYSIAGRSFILVAPVK